MDYIFFIFSSAMQDLIRNKLRTLLTSLGILIGVSSVVLLLAFGLGLKEYIRQQFDSLGTNLIFVLPGQVFGQSGGGGFAASRSTASFDEKDLATLRRIKSSEFVIPLFTKTVKIEANGKTQFSTLNASTSDIFPGRNLAVEYGRLYDKTDDEKRSRVIVVGPDVIEKLFDNPLLAVGKNVRIDNQTFKIVGVLKAKGGGGFGGPSFDQFTYMPFRTAYVFNPDKKIINFVMKASSQETLNILKAEIGTALEKRYSTDDFTVADSREFIATISQIFSILNTVLVAIGAVSLVVGGIGIMNIMYVSVTERIREIGIRRALGAQERDILFQFLMESVLLSLFGGIAGLALAHTIILFIRAVFPAYVDINSMIIALGTSSFIGIFFGVFPARKAARLSPMEAIRYE